VSTLPEDQVLLALARLAMDVSIRATEELGTPSPVQLRALTALRKLGEANLAQLSEDMGVTVPGDRQESVLVALAELTGVADG
jgi:hypothetical protein